MLPKTRSAAAACAAVVISLGLQQCTATPPTQAAAAPAADTAAAPTPVLSVKELMEHVIDPTADWIFDAAVVDVTAAGVAETQPVSDEDWLKVERGALLLAESSNLLKMPRAMAPAGTEAAAPPPGGGPPPELSPAEIQAKVDKDPALWSSHADQLRVAALGALPVIRARNVEALFKIGTDIDNACEGCHLEFWYPGDRKVVEADRQKRATYAPVK